MAQEPAAVVVAPENQRQITLVFSSVSVLALLLGITGTAAGSIGVSFGRQLKKHGQNTEKTRNKLLLAAILTAVSVLSIIIAIFFIVKGKETITRAWRSTRFGRPRAVIAPGGA